MKKKVFITIPSLGIGGAESALIALLNSFDYSRYDVDLFLFNHTGENLTNIPKKIHLLPEIKQYSGLEKSIVSNIKELNIGVVFGRLCGKLFSTLYDHVHHWKDSSFVPLQQSHRFSKCFLPKISKNITYDAAISFLTPHYIVAEKVNAKKKFAWIHTDYSTMHNYVKSEIKMWNKYDNIISISENVTKAFSSKFHQLQDKIVLIENIMQKNIINSKADIEEVTLYQQGVSLLSVGRFAYAKNFDNVPEIAGIIKSKGIDFKWYIIGYGGEEPVIRSKIKEFNMQDTVIILGKKENPYPYIKACDIYVQPSRYEGKAVTVHEALILNKPIIITDYPTAKSQLQDGFDGVIVPMENSKCADAIVDFINNKELQNKLIENMKSTNYSNESEIEKLYKLIED